MRLINFSFAVFAAASLCAATKPVTYDPSSSKLVHPGASALVAANPELGMAINLLKRDFYIYIDTIPSPADDSMSYGSYSRTNPFYYKGTDGTVARTVNVSGGAMSTFADYYRYYNISSSESSPSGNYRFQSQNIFFWHLRVFHYRMLRAKNSIYKL